MKIVKQQVHENIVNFVDEEVDEEISGHLYAEVDGCMHGRALAWVFNQVWQQVYLNIYDEIDKNKG